MPFVYLKTDPDRGWERQFKIGRHRIKYPIRTEHHLQLDKPSKDVFSRRLLGCHATPKGSRYTSATYIQQIRSSIRSTVSNYRRWDSVIKDIMSLSVCLTTFFSAVKGGFIGPGNFTSPYDRKTQNLTGTGCWDNIHQRTSGFVFFLGHFGTPTDLKHMSGYGQEEKFSVWREGMEPSYAQRRYVCLDADVDMYRKGLVMIHDVVWPRHLLKSRKGIKIEAYWEDVNTGIRYDDRKRRLPEQARDDDYDPHSAGKGDPYLRAQLIKLHNTDNDKTLEIRPLESFIAGSHCRLGIALETVRFADFFDILPSSLKNIGKLIEFINKWIRPQVLIPGTVEVPGLDAYDKIDIWEKLKEKSNGGDTTGAREFLFAHYKCVKEKWKRMLSLSSRLDSDGTYDKGRRLSSSDGFRKFGWPKEKYQRMDVRTIMEPMNQDKTRFATGKRWEYRSLWNGLPELAAFSAYTKRYVKLDRSKVSRPNTTIALYEPKEGTEVTIGWNNKVTE